MVESNVGMDKVRIAFGTGVRSISVIFWVSKCAYSLLPESGMDLKNKPKELLIHHICIIIKKKLASNGQFSGSWCLIIRFEKNVD